MRLAVLCNGPSLATLDLERISIPVMGLNRSWKAYPWPLLHLSLDTDHFREGRQFFKYAERLGKLYVAGGAWKELTPKANILPIRSDVEFSTDLALGIVPSLYGVGSVFYAGLQVAYCLGYREILALGLDLQGDHFDGTPASPNVAKQNLLFANIPTDMTVLTCGSPDSLAVFEKVGFEAVCS